MNINKKLLAIFMFLFLSSTVLHAEDTINLDDEELPAIDPFQGGSASTTTQGLDTSNNQSVGGGMLNGLRLVGTMIGENKKLAIFAAPDGMTYKFQELQEVVTDALITDIFEDYVVIQSSDSSFYEVYMNNVIKPSDG